jgi:hypothetical protein
MTVTDRRRPVPDRARKRAIRALAARLGVPYSVAARLVAGPAGSALGEQRPFHARVRDTREAVELPLGRAAHLTARFPRVFTSAGVLYDGAGRETTLAMMYAVIAHESPESVPGAEELAWVAELGEETAVDITCAGLDRAARLLLDEDRWRLWTRVEAALAAGEAVRDRRTRDGAVTLGRELRAVSLRSSLAGARQILDALLAGAYEAHVPGSRIRAGGRPAVVVGIRWPQEGPPTAYEVRLPNDAATHTVPLPRED